jgi:hypothetical protein
MFCAHDQTVTQAAKVRVKRAQSRRELQKLKNHLLVGQKSSEAKTGQSEATGLRIGLIVLVAANSQIGPLDYEQV